MESAYPQCNYQMVQEETEKIQKSHLQMDSSFSRHQYGFLKKKLSESEGSIIFFYGRSPISFFNIRWTLIREISSSVAIFRADTRDFRRKRSFIFLMFAFVLTKRRQPDGLDRLMVPV